VCPKKKKREKKNTMVRNNLRNVVHVVNCTAFSFNLLVVSFSYFSRARLPSDVVGGFYSAAASQVDQAGRECLGWPDGNMPRDQEGGLSDCAALPDRTREPRLGRNLQWLLLGYCHFSREGIEGCTHRRERGPERVCGCASRR
jgi:hypothetical protein